MKLTVCELLEAEEFMEYKVICGRSGLDREVTSASVMDAPDIYEWLKGGEVLLTSGFILKNNLDSFTELLRKIASHGAAALFIKLGRFIEDVPEETKRVADELGFPIILMPYSKAFIDVITPVLTKVNTRQLEIIQRSEKINCVFTNIAVSQEGIPKVLEYLQGLLGEKVFLVDSMKNRIFTTQGKTVCDSQEYMKKYPCFPVVVSRRLFGYLVVEKEKYKANEYDLIAIEHASTIIKLEMQREISNDEVERKYRDNLVLDIIYKNYESVEELKERGQVFGWSFEQCFRVMIAEVDHFKRTYEKAHKNNKEADNLSRQVTDLVIREVQLRFPKSVFVTFTNRVVFLLWDQEVSHEQMKERLASVNRKAKEELHFTISFAFGGLANSIGKAAKSYEEAKTTLRLGRMLGWENTTFFYNQLGFYRLLDKLKDNEAVLDFYNEKMNVLVQYDHENNADYDATLQALIDCNWNLRDTSEHLFIHYNTMKNRYKKIQEIMDMSLDSMEERLEIEFAMKAKMVNGL